MAIRQDKVQIQIEFINDESKAFAKTLLDTKELNKQLAESRAKLVQYNQQLAAVGADESKRAAILSKISAEESNVARLLGQIAAEAKKVAAIDLTRLTPAQLTERARQLAQAMRDIPASAPQFRELEAELARVNGQLGQLRANAKGIQSDGAAAGGESGGGFFSTVVGKATVAIAAVQAVFATLQGLFNFAKTAVAEFRAGAAAEAALASRIESTDGAAGRTVEQLTEQAKELQKVTFFTDEQTGKGQEILLTFTNIRGEIFDRTIPAAQDLSTVFGQDLQASAVQLGKALNDPVRGITALRRVGITFSEEQERTIKNFVETNRLAEAQAVILGEVERQVGGASRAAAEAEGGGYRLLQQRLGEVQEGFGALISVGLDKLQPFFEGFVTVLEKVVGALTSGKAATGEYSGAANFLVGIVKALGVTFNVLGTILGGVFRFFNNIVEYVVSDVVPAFQSIGRGISNFIEASQRLPIIGTLIRGVVATVILLRDAIANLPATLAGFRAAAQQAVENIARFFSNLILSAKILAKELELALTIKSEARAELLTDINNLKQQQASAAAAGKSIGEAYTEARNKALAEGNAKAAEETKKTVQARPQAPGEDFSVGGQSPEDAATRRKKALDADLKEVEAAALRRETVLENFRLKEVIGETRYQEGLLDVRRRKLQEQLAVYRKFKQDESVEALKIANELIQIETEGRKKIQESALQVELTNVEQVNIRRETVLEGQRLREEVSEQQYQERIVELKRLKLEDQLEVYRKFGQDQTTEALKVQNELARIEVETVQRSREEQLRIRLDIVEADKNAMLAGLQDKFSQALIAEQDYNLQKLELQRLALEAELAILRERAPEKVDEIKKREEAILKIEEDILKKRAENRLRLEELEQKAEQEGLKALGDVFQIGADLLSKDEKSKQKHAGVVKALQVANVQVNLAAEVSGIFANAQKSAIAQLLGPVAGNILAGIQAALATVRAGIAIGKINAVKFARGTLMAIDYVKAKTGFFGGKPHSQGGTKGYFEDGTVIEVEKDEAFAVVNKHNAPLLRMLSNINALGGKGVPFFAKGGVPRFDTGGLPNINTTPAISPLDAPVQIQDTSVVERMERAAATMLAAAQAFPRKVKADVVYTEIEDAGTELNVVREDAAL